MSAIANVITFDKLREIARELGKEAGKGRDTQIKFALSLVEGSYHNAIDLSPNKHGKDVDDAQKLTEEYVLSQRSATIFDAKAANQRKAISCHRACIKLGQWTKGGNGEPLHNMNNLMSMRQKLKAIPDEAKKLDDAFNTLVKYARTQVKRDSLIGDAELKDMCFKPGAALKTPEQIIETIRNQLDSLIRGEASQGTAQDATKKVIEAKNALTDRLKEIATARGKAKGPSGVVQAVAAVA